MILAAACLLSYGCSKKSINNKENNLLEVSTWAKDNQVLPSCFVFPQREYSLEEGFVPWGGTVSHHFLTAPLIDDWFCQISKRRRVDTFFMICPSHYGLSTFDYSVAFCKWNCGEKGFVETDVDYSSKVAEELKVGNDSEAFLIEHGASTLMPYIKKYFPDAKVVVIAVNGEPPVSIEYAKKLSDCLRPYFDKKGKRENFLIVSTDFSHHGTVEQTEYKDNISLHFFNDPSVRNFIAAVCDNRVGIYALSSFIKPEDKARILYHTDSFSISGEDENDITSYYFSLFGNAD